MMIWLAGVAFLMLLLLPFVIGMGEFRSKKDSKPLFIDMDYCRDPRYFAVSFKKKLAESLSIHVTELGVQQIMLSKPELVTIAGEAVVSSDTVADNIYYVKRDLESTGTVIFPKEVYVRGEARLGESNQLRALACDGHITVGNNSRFSRWLDADGRITAGENCDLGISASCGQILHVAAGCTFKRLYAPLITAGKPGEAKVKKPVTASDGFFVHEKCVERNVKEIAAGEHKTASLISADAMHVAESAVIGGHVKAHGNLTIREGVMIAGNVFAEGDITLGAYSRVCGNVFSQGHVRLEEGVTVGVPDAIKSVIGKKSVCLSNGATVYGYVMTEGEGTVI